MIDRWVRQGLIAPDQAKKIEEDVRLQRVHHVSKLLTILFSVLGLLFLIFGFSYFLMDYWMLLDKAFKVGAVAVLTLVAAGVGENLRFKNKNKLLSNTFFVAAMLLFAATLTLSVRLYNLDIYDKNLFMIWLIGITPLVYVMQIALMSILYYAGWLFRALTGLIPFFSPQDALEVPYILVLWGMIFFFIGVLHTYFVRYQKTGRYYMGIALAPFLLGLVIGANDWFLVKAAMRSSQIVLSAENRLYFLEIAGAAILLSLAPLLFNTFRTRVMGLTVTLSLSIIAFVMTFSFYPTLLGEGPVNYWFYFILLQLLFALTCLLMLFAGLRIRNFMLFTYGIIASALFVQTVFMWLLRELFPALPFFARMLLNGGILIALAVVVFKVRKRLEQEF